MELAELQIKLMKEEAERKSKYAAEIHELEIKILNRRLAE